MGAQIARSLGDGARGIVPPRAGAVASHKRIQWCCGQRRATRRAAGLFIAQTLARRRIVLWARGPAQMKGYVYIQRSAAHRFGTGTMSVIHRGKPGPLCRYELGRHRLKRGLDRHCYGGGGGGGGSGGGGPRLTG